MWTKLLSYVLKSALDKRKEKLKNELQAKIDETDSDWVKVRSKGYMALIDGASAFLLGSIEKEIKKL